MFLEGLWNLGIWNPESGVRNPFKCHLLEQYFKVLYSFFVSRSAIRTIIIISSLTLQDIEQNVSETLADQGIKEPVSLKHELRIGYKTWTRYKTRTAGCGLGKR